MAAVLDMSKRAGTCTRGDRLLPLEDAPPRGAAQGGGTGRWAALEAGCWGLGGGGSWATLLGPQTQEPGSPQRQGGAREMLASLDLKPCYPLLLPCLSFLCLPSDYCRLPVEGIPGKIIGNCYT